GVLFRQEEAEMRRKLIEADLIECVLGLGPNLFYNSPMEACVVVCRTQKPKTRRGKILFINAVNEVTRERAQSFLTDDHLARVVEAYRDFRDEPGFTRVVSIEEIRAKDGNLSIPLYVCGETQAQRDATAQSDATALPAALSAWTASSLTLRRSVETIVVDERNKDEHVLLILLTPPPMRIFFRSSKLEKVCNSEREMRKTFGKPRVRKLQQRLMELSAAENLTQIFRVPPPRCHELTSNRKGQLSVDLDHPYRLIFIPANDPLPLKADGGLNWDEVTEIEIIEIADPH
ncbi:MAG: N-6 DNA methylase, partial [Chthoniobacterales bacterium]